MTRVGNSEWHFEKEINFGGKVKTTILMPMEKQYAWQVLVNFSSLASLRFSQQPSIRMWHINMARPKYIRMQYTRLVHFLKVANL